MYRSYIKVLLEKCVVNLKGSVYRLNMYVKGGDETVMSIERIIEEYGDYLLRVAYVYVKNKETAEDIVQDVFIAFYEKQHQYKEQASLKTYLVKMTVNRCHDYFRSWRYKRVVLFEKVTGKSSEETPEAFVMQNEQSTDLLAVLLTLSLAYREVIILYYYEEMSTVEIAKVLNCPESTVRTRLQRARKQLKNKMVDVEWEELSYESN